MLSRELTHVLLFVVFALSQGGCKNSFILTKGTMENRSACEDSASSDSNHYCSVQTDNKKQPTTAQEDFTPVLLKLSKPTNLTYDYLEYAGAPMLDMEWELGAYSGTTIKKQEVLVFADSFTCSGDPVYAVNIPTTSMSVELDRFVSNEMVGKLSFKVKITYATGDASISDCGVAGIPLENHAAVFPSPVDDVIWNNLNLGDYLKHGDLNGDGKHDVITYGTYDGGSKGLLVVRFSKTDSHGSDVRFFTHSVPITNSALIVALDLTGDGKDELIVSVGSEFFILTGSTDFPASGALSSRFRSYSLPVEAAGYFHYGIDFNNDGRKELLYMSDDGFVIIEGASNLPASGAALAHKIFTFEANGDNTCVDVDVVDWNLDGYQDFICYADFSHYNALQAGSIIAIPGGPTLPSSGTITTRLKRYYGTYGMRVGYRSPLSSDSRLHDVTGDGYPEIITGFYEIGSGSGAGGVHIVVGGPTFPDSGHISGLGGRGRLYTGQTNYNHLGERIIIADVTGDGINDIVSYSSFSDDTGVGTADGALFLIPGAANLPPSGPINGGVGYTYLGENGERAAQSLLVTDINNDGIPDMLLTSSSSNSNGSSSGGAYLILGGTPPASGRLPLAAFRYWTGEAASHQLRLTAVDLDGDGVKEIVAGSPIVSSNRGRIYIFDHTKTSGSVLNDSTYYTGATTSDRLGHNQYFEDINNDGLIDIISVYDVADGRVHFIPGSNPMPATAAINVVGTSFVGTNADDRLGANSKFLDVNNDGFLDFVSMNGLANSGGTLKGVMYIIEGNVNALPAAMKRYYGQYDNDQVGNQIYWDLYYHFEDINRDGAKDFIVANKSVSPDGKAGAGSIFILPGGPLPASGPLTGWIRLDGADTGDALGSNMKVQDMNGDGFIDLLAFRKDGFMIFQDGSKGGEIDITPQPTTYFHAPGDIGVNFTTIDLTGDGKLDIFGLIGGHFHTGTANGAVIVQPIEFIPQSNL